MNIHILTTYVPQHMYICTTTHLHYPDFYKALNNREPTYILGDLNARHSILGYNSNNIRGKQLATLINRGHATHTGPDFPTLLTHRSATTPDIILTNNRVFHNTHASPGTILTPSDHIYIKFTISSSPIQIPIKERPSLKKADWETYRDRLNATLTVNQAPKTCQQIETLANTWTEQIK